MYNEKEIEAIKLEMAQFDNPDNAFLYILNLELKRININLENLQKFLGDFRQYG